MTQTSSWQALNQLTAKQQRFVDLINQQCCGEQLERGNTIHCRKGCSGCCSLNVHCSFTEVAAILPRLSQQMITTLIGYAKQLQQLANQTTDLKTFLSHSRQQLGNCPFLDENGSCHIYSVRPLSCRALLSTKEPHYCSLDFSTLSSQEKQDFMASLDQTVVNFPTHYLAIPQQIAMTAEQQCSDSMINSFGFALSGSLPYLVFLEQQFQLSDQIEQGLNATLEFLENQQLNTPFLLQVMTSNEPLGSLPIYTRNHK